MLRAPLLTLPLTVSENSTSNYQPRPNDTPLYSVRGCLSMAPSAFFEEDLLNWVSPRCDLRHIREQSFVCVWHNLPSFGVLPDC